MVSVYLGAVLPALVARRMLRGERGFEGIACWCVGINGGDEVVGG